GGGGRARPRGCGARRVRLRRRPSRVHARRPRACSRAPRPTPRGGPARAGDGSSAAAYGRAQERNTFHIARRSPCSGPLYWWVVRPSLLHAAGSRTARSTRESRRVILFLGAHGRGLPRRTSATREGV